MNTASRKKIREYLEKFLTEKIVADLPGKFIRDMSEQEYHKFFQNDVIFKKENIISFSELKSAFEKKVLDSREETARKILDMIAQRMSSLDQLSDEELDRLIRLLETPEGYIIRKTNAAFLENIYETMDGISEKLMLECFDSVIELVDLRTKEKKRDDSKIAMN